MDAAINIVFPYVEEEKSKKVINFSSNTIKAISNVPGAIVSIIILPVYIIVLMPLTNLLLWQLINKIKRQADKLKKQISGIPYEEARIGYDLMSKLVLMLDNIVTEIQPASDNFLTKGMFNKIKIIAAVYKEMQTSLSNSLFLKVNNCEPLSDKEKESYRILNEVWGDDDDQVYAKHTHHCLTQK